MIVSQTIPSGARGEVAHRPSGPAPRTLIVGSAIGGGGAERRFRLLLEHLFGGTADGIALCACPAPELRAGQSFKSLGWRGKRDYAKAVFALRRALSRRRHEAVISLGLYPNVLLWAASRALRNRPALIMTEITRPYTESIKFSGPINARVRQPLYRMSYGGADLVAANSEDGLYEIITHYGVKPETAIRVPNLIEADRVNVLAGPQSPDTDIVAGSGPLRICMVARFDPIKRVDTLLYAAHALGPAFSWAIDLVGDGPQRPRIEALVDELSIRTRVTLHGWLENPYPVIKAAGVTVLCSEYEGFSNTVLESMVIGTPVITSFCSQDSRDMAAAGAVLGFEIGDWCALRGHLVALQEEPQLAAKLRSRASAYAARHHVSNAVTEYEALVRKTVSLRASGNR